MRAAAGVSTALDPLDAVRDAIDHAVCAGSLGKVDFALVLATTAHGNGIETIARRAAELIQAERLLGTSVEGVIGAGREVLRNPAVAVLAIEDCEVVPFSIDEVAGDEAGACSELASLLDAPLELSDLVVAFPDPLSIVPDRLLPRLESALGPARLVGGAAGAVGHGGAISWLGDGELRTGALAGFLARDLARADVAVTQACRFVTQPLEVTRARGNWILSIAGRPALEVYRQAANLREEGDLDAALRYALVGRCGADDQLVEVRHVVGIDRARDAISLPTAVRSGDRIRMACIDADSARRELGEMLDATTLEAELGLYFNCRARGEALFGVAGLEAGYLERRYGSTPVVGSFGAFQISPRGLAASSVLTYAAVLALLA